MQCERSTCALSDTEVGARTFEEFQVAMGEAVLQHAALPVTEGRAAIVEEFSVDSPASLAIVPLGSERQTVLHCKQLLHGAGEDVRGPMAFAGGIHWLLL